MHLHVLSRELKYGFNYRFLLPYRELEMAIIILSHIGSYVTY